MDIILRILAATFGALLVFFALFSAIKTLVIPRAMPDPITGATYGAIRWIFNIPMRWAYTYQARDWIMIYYAPLALLALLPVWLLLVKHAAIWQLFPIFLFSSVIAGVLTGWLAALLLEHLREHRIFKQEPEPVEGSPANS